MTFCNKKGAWGRQSLARDSCHWLTGRDRLFLQLVSMLVAVAVLEWHAELKNLQAFSGQISPREKGATHEMQNTEFFTGDFHLEFHACAL